MNVFLSILTKEGLLTGNTQNVLKKEKKYLLKLHMYVIKFQSKFVVELQ